MGQRGRKPKEEGEVSLVKFEMGVEPKLIAYLDDIVTVQGYGNTRSAVARRFVWDGINGLIRDHRISPR